MTDRQTACMHARQDRVLGDVSWTRGQCQKHECRSQQADVHGFELPARMRRVARWRHRTLPSQGSACARPPQRVPALRNVDDGPQPIPLKVQHTNPGLACSPDKAQIEVPGSGKRIGKRVEPFVSAGTVRGSGVSSPAFPPRSTTSQLRPLSFSLCRITFSFLGVDRRFDVQAASLTFARFEAPAHPADRDSTLVVSLLPSLPFFRLVPHEKQTQLSRVQPPIGATTALTVSPQFLFVCSFDTRPVSLSDCRQTSPLRVTSSLLPHPLSRLGGAYLP